MKLFLQKNEKFSSAGGSALRPRASGGWGLCPQILSLRQLGALPPDPHWPPAAGAPPPDPQTAPPHCEFLATRLAVSYIIFQYSFFSRC